MGELFKIAWRNIREHKVKTAIISLIMIIGIMVLVIGNSLMDTATKGIERYYTKNYTGHLMITGRTKGNLTLFGYQDMTAMEQTVPRIPEYSEILEFVRSLPYVAEVNPQVSTIAMVSKEDDTLTATQLFGIVPDQYQRMFPDNVELIKGSFWGPGEQGILLNEPLAEAIERRSGIAVEPGDKLLFTSAGMLTGMRIREVEVTGIFRFKQSNLQLDMVSLMDVSNARALAGMVVGSADTVELADDENFFVGEIDADNIFDSLFAEVETEEEEFGDDYWFSLLGGLTLETSQPGRYGCLAVPPVRLEDERYLKQAEREMAQFFAEHNIPAETRSWRQGAGAIAEMSYGIKRIFNGVVLVIAVVAIIIIMNTLVISITERMAEIGTMRAIGAQKGFVRRMVLAETLLLSGISGTIGIVLGGIILLILNVIGLEASNAFYEILYGGPVLRPELSLSAVVMSFIVVVVVGLISSTYPTSIVMRTSPLQAMESRGD